MGVIKQESIAEMVAEHLRCAVDSGTLKAGQKITEQEICNLLQVSRTPVREAFRILQVEGYLQYKQRYGVFVVEVSEKDICDVWEIRIAVEDLVARKTAARADEKLKKRIRKQLAIINQLKKDELDEKIFRNLDEEYYEIHITGCGNRKLEEVARNLRVNAALIRRKPRFSKDRAVVALKEISAIYNAYLDNDQERAAQLNKQHFEASLIEIRKYM